MKRDDLAREWEKLAPAWIREAREGRNAARVGLLDALILEACGNLAGRRALDCGCGEGRFCRILLERGVEHVLGLDLCQPMIEAADGLKSGKDEYQVADVQNLSFLRNESFDLAVSYLNQCDLPDFQANNLEVFRILKPGGRFVIANLHPMRSAVGGWHESENGRKVHVVLDRYFEENDRQWMMLSVKFTNFHRSLSTYVNGLITAGFAIERIVEPTATRDQLQRYPELIDETRVPNFIIYQCLKPCT